MAGPITRRLVAEQVGEGRSRREDHGIDAELLEDEVEVGHLGVELPADPMLVVEVEPALRLELASPAAEPCGLEVELNDRVPGTTTWVAPAFRCRSETIRNAGFMSH